MNAAAALRGAAADARAKYKRNKYRNDIPGLAHFLALPFETEGYVSADVDRLLHGFAKLKVSRGDPNLSPEEAKRQASAFKAPLARRAGGSARALPGTLHHQPCFGVQVRGQPTRASAARPSWT